MRSSWPRPPRRRLRSNRKDTPPLTPSTRWVCSMPLQSLMTTMIKMSNFKILLTNKRILRKVVCRLSCTLVTIMSSAMATHVQKSTSILITTSLVTVRRTAATRFRTSLKVLPISSESLSRSPGSTTPPTTRRLMQAVITALKMNRQNYSANTLKLRQMMRW